MSGFPTWGSDVGGYDGPPYVGAQLFVRWAQLGAVSPVLEVGGQGKNATPWQLGTAAMNGLRGAAVLHYELFPYLFGLLAAHAPVLRPLGYAYPDDPSAWGANYEFLVGPDLLAAPVTGPGTTPSVYLPRGSWIDLYSGTNGRRRRTRLHAPDTAPAVSALRARGLGPALQPAHGPRLVVGRRRAQPPRPSRLPRDRRRDGST